MKFNFKNFVQEIHSSFQDKISEEQVQTLLFVDEESYVRDSPSSIGKGLTLNKIRFQGQKSDGTVIDYFQDFYSGVNLWIGENFKGKSSFFKIIKFALTGHNTIENDVKKWIKQIYLEFSLGEKIFTIYINDEGKRQLATLYNRGYDELINSTEDEISNFIEFSVNTKETYIDLIEGFFFKNFSFYNLKWTQNSSRKDNTDLDESKASWRTYFKSIYLESKDSQVLFWGNQAELIFLMLLGLELTHPINRLKIKCDFLENNIGNLKNAQKIQADNDEKKKQEEPLLKEKLAKVVSDVEELKKGTEVSKILKQLEDDYSKALQRKRNINETRRVYYENLNLKRTEFNTLGIKQTNISNEIEKYAKEIGKADRRTLDLNEHIDLKLFFTNLEVHSCPHCDHNVEKERKKREQDTGKCMLCDNNISKEDVDTKEFENKRDQIIKDRELLRKEEYGIKLQWQDIKAQIKLVYETIKAIEANILEIEKDPIDNTIKELEGKIDTIRKDKINYFTKYESLLNEKVRLEAQIKTLSNKDNENPNNKKIEQCELEVQILKQAISTLKEVRSTKSNEIINKLEYLLLEQTKNLGFVNISSVKIDRINFRLSFIKNDETFDFKDLSEGEQLRIKLALYLSVIKMDILFNHGRHPRFLILDAPTKEEADKLFVEGFGQSLQKIETEFKDKLQIFIGTAKYELSNVASKEKIKLLIPNQYLF